MRILIVGASGTIGRAVAGDLGGRHDILTAGRSSGDLRVDITHREEIRAMYEKAGPLDAVVAATGKVRFEPLAAMTAEAYEFGLQDKLMGQVNLVLIGRAFLVAGGSFTLTSGILDHEPVRLGSSASMVNGAVNAFVRAAALEMPNGQRINAVCPGVVQEALAAHGAFFRGFEPVPAARVALAYARSVEGGQNGQVYRVQ